MHTELHDHARHVEDHPVERVQGEQVGQRLPAQVEDQVVDQFLATGTINEGSPAKTTIDTIVGKQTLTTACALGFTVNEVPEGYPS
ncbi:hypothetical protein [Amycolatopsis panacis]|uniref:hypothetical protein n=1 Tax=Amycolatopsis panacis TaxID=2340917 RepID=UPI001F2D50D2|nr:hypothetical protein [Amycolatopsis panacis]